MFTGIIEEVGKIKEISLSDGGAVLSIEGKKVLEDIHIGDSIAINGICLTVVAFDATRFKVEAAPETLRLTTLSQWKTGGNVNLERAMKADGRFGGHWVTGHIDGVATITQHKDEGNATIVTFRMEKPELMKYLVQKGSIAVDGVSLTIIHLTEETFSVSLIPQTLKETILSQKRKGDKVNIEVDILAKYLERFLIQTTQQQEPGINFSLLRQSGFVL